jgi:hypothetical protein
VALGDVSGLDSVLGGLSLFLLLLDSLSVLDVVGERSLVLSVDPVYHANQFLLVSKEVSDVSQTQD